MDIQPNKKRIARNTLFLYFRMLLVMAVSLYTQRIVLEKLGTSDYGIYYAVAGVVAMLSFLNGTLSTGTSRFLTFEMGRGNFDRLKNTFSTAFYSHLILSGIITVLLLTGGIWFVEHKLIIPPERLIAAEWVLVISVFTIFISITQVPYTSVIIAHENMSIYAYIGLFEAGAKLGVVYLLSISPWDRLIFYSILIALVQIIIALFYRYYCVWKYAESHLLKHFDGVVFKDMLKFSSWSLVANISQMLGTYGLTIIMNMFFSPLVVAAQAIGNQINNAISSFKNNFSTAVNPQIIKLYSAEQYTESRKLTLETSIYIYELMLLLSLPIIVQMKPILNLWLVEVPKYAVIFSQWILVSQLLGTYSMTLYTPMMASGHLKENSYASVFVTIFGVICLYFMLQAGWDVMWVQYMCIIQTILYSYVVKPIILCKYIPDYNWKHIFINTWQMVKVTIFPIIVCLLIYNFVPSTNLWLLIINTTVIMISVCISTLVFMDKTTKYKLVTVIKNKILRNYTYNEKK